MDPTAYMYINKVALARKKNPLIFIHIESNVSGNISKFKCLRTLTYANITYEEITHQKNLKIAVTTTVSGKYYPPVFYPKHER